LDEDCAKEGCDGSSKVDTSVFNLVKNWSKAALKIIVSEVDDFEKVLLEGFLEFLHFSYP
jgi:hypothetical protein